MRNALVVGLAVICCAVAGCSGNAPLTAPSYSASSIAAAAFDEYDTNKDGKLDDKELEHCPALKNSVKDLDTDGDKAISREELEARLSEFISSRVALQSVSCRVFRAGSPVPKVNVKFVPEKFHGSAIAPAQGISDANGLVELMTEGKDVPGLAPGFYRVELSLKDASGKETLPARVNQQTKLGYQIGPRLRGGIDIQIP